MRWRERSGLSNAQAASARAADQDILGGAKSEPVGFEIMDNNDGSRGGVRAERRLVAILAADFAGESRLKQK
jgi:hypothetical protein